MPTDCQPHGELWETLNMKLGGSHNRSGSFGEEKIFSITNN